MMKLAASNIAWDVADDERVGAMLVESGYAGVEIAPTKYWDRLSEVSAEEVSAVRRAWEARGLRVAAVQALLYGRPELEVFGEASVRRGTLDYLARVIDVAAALGAETLVFGSPKQRRTHGRSAGEVREIAEDFFGRLAGCAAARGVWVGMEANPAAYGCDFVTTTAEAWSLVERVGKTGFGLHLDVGGAVMNGDGFEEALRAAGIWCRHVHVSEPELAAVGTRGSDHLRYARSLGEAGYARWVSVEMRPAGEEALARSLRYVAETYGEAGFSGWQRAAAG